MIRKTILHTTPAYNGLGKYLLEEGGIDLESECENTVMITETIRFKGMKYKVQKPKFRAKVTGQKGEL